MSSDLIKFFKKVNLEDFTLIVPSVSVGNVPQLTVDILIASYKFTHVGVLWHPAIIPSIGPDPFDINSGNVSTGCDLYVNEELKLATFQIRSGISKLQASDLFQKLVKTINDLKIKLTVILGSSFAHEMHDVKSSCYRCLTNQAIDDKLTEYDFMKYNDEESYGGIGFAITLYNILNDAKIPSLCLIKYVSEGDNRPDAMQMLRKLSIVHSDLTAPEEKMLFPVSWEFVYGNDPPLGLY